MISKHPANATLLHITTLLPKFALLIEKDGGIRPCDVLATCTYKVLHSTWQMPGKISESQTSRPTFRYKLFIMIPPILFVISPMSVRDFTELRG
jgi:hypothetical protein